MSIINVPETISEYYFDLLVQAKNGQEYVPNPDNPFDKSSPKIKMVVELIPRQCVICNTTIVDAEHPKRITCSQACSKRRIRARVLLGKHRRRQLAEVQK